MGSLPLCYRISIYGFSCSFKLGNGRIILSWHDSWLNNSPLKLCYSQLFKISSTANDSVASHWMQQFSLCIITSHRFLKDGMLPDFPNLLVILSRVHIGSTKDTRSIFSLIVSWIRSSFTYWPSLKPKADLLW